MKEKKLFTIAGIFIALVLLVFYVNGNLGQEPPVDTNTFYTTNDFLENKSTKLSVDTPDVEQDTLQLPKPSSKKEPIKPSKKTVSKRDSAKQDITVIICNSENSYAYHVHECRGLKSCRAGTKNITKTEAEGMGRRPCRNCY